MGFGFAFGCLVILAATVLWPNIGEAQSVPPAMDLPHELTSAERESDQSTTAKDLVPDILRHQKSIWTFPFHVGEHLKPAIAVSVSTAALVALDPYVAPHFQNSRFDVYKTGALRKQTMALTIAAVPVVTYLGGLLRKDEYAQETGLLAAEAIADTLIVSTVIKGITGRTFPVQIPSQGDFTRTWFKYTGPAHDPGSFPSGHAISAFAAAAVYSSRYRHHRWAPFVAYGLASLVSLTRIPDQTHFPSDVFAGAALGYTIGKFVVVRH